MDFGNNNHSFDFKKELVRRNLHITRRKLKISDYAEKDRPRIRKLRKKYRKQTWRRYSKRYYKYIIKPRKLAEEKERGEEHGVYLIYITKRKKKERYLHWFGLKTKAYEKYNQLVEENRKNVLFPKKSVRNGSQDTQRELDMEIILVKRATNNAQTLVTAFKDEYGKVVETKVDSKKESVILEKNEWRVEEDFYCYGYHPVRNRKNYEFILNEWVLNDRLSYDITKRISKFKNKVIIRDAEDFNFVVCKDKKQAESLYDKIMDDCDEMKLKHIFFLGNIPSTMTRETYEMLENKTGWEKKMLYREKL